MLGSFLALATALTLTAPAAFALQGGKYAAQDRFPGTIAFYLPKTLTQERCTAVKVAPAIFLTAAHCFDRYEKDGAKPNIVFVANQQGQPVMQFPRFLVRAPVIHPDYYKTDGFFSAFRNTQWGSNPDLALIKINEDISDLTTATLAPSNFHLGQTFLIGGFGPDQAEKECTPTPCSIRMGTARVTELKSQEVLLSNNALFLTGGDSGGPAYELRATHLVVTAINQGCDNLHQAGGKISRLTKIDLTWYRANLDRIQNNRK